jgi:hypothetical protein
MDITDSSLRQGSQRIGVGADSPATADVNNHSEKTVALLKKNIDYMQLIINILPQLDKVCNKVLQTCNVQKELNVDYKLEMYDTAGQLDGKTIKINPLYFMKHDNKLADTSELEFVLAHEIGHHKFPYWAPPYAFLIVNAFFCYKMDFRTLPVILSSIVSVVGVVWLKRREESWCDNYAAKKVGTDGGIKFFKYCIENRRNMSWISQVWHYDFAHPSPYTRLKAMQNFSDIRH